MIYTRVSFFSYGGVDNRGDDHWRAAPLGHIFYCGFIMDLLDRISPKVNSTIAGNGAPVHTDRSIRSVSGLVLADSCKNLGVIFTFAG